MKKLNGLEMVSLVLIIVGGLNWLLIGIFSFDLVATIFGEISIVSRIVYTLVGLSAIYWLAMLGKVSKK